MVAIAKIDKQKGNPEIEVIIGQAQQGRYIIRLWDEKGKTPSVIGEGVNWDNVADIFPIGAVNELDKRIVSWDVVVSAPQAGDGQLYSVSVKIKQNGTAVENGVFQETGKLKGTKAVLGLCMLSVS